MGHPNEEFLRQFFTRHRRNLEHFDPEALVTRALEEFQRFQETQREEEIDDGT